VRAQRSFARVAFTILQAPAELWLPSGRGIVKVASESCIRHDAPMRVTEPVWIALAGVGFGAVAFALAALRRRRRVDDGQRRRTSSALDRPQPISQSASQAVTIERER
jgi:hypothetical protein